MGNNVILIDYVVRFADGREIDDGVYRMVLDRIIGLVESEGMVLGGSSALVNQDEHMRSDLVIGPGDD